LRRFAIIIPVKGDNPKGRLGALFTLRQKKQLQVSMLEDTLGALSGAKKLAQTYVVSSDLDILKFAERYGAGSIGQVEDGGVNDAVQYAISALGKYDGWMIIPADLPLLAGTDIRTVLTLVRMGSKMVISPSEDYSGTNLMLVSKKAMIPLHYDDDSFNKHVEEATKRGVRFAVYYSQNVAFDIDKASDVHKYFSFGRRNSTMNFLERTLKIDRDIERMKEREGERRDPDSGPR
jgi:2-phospho-L-lactate guanylyltransferase